MTENPEHTTSSPSDAELVRRFKGGDEEAFSMIVLRYQVRLTRIAVSVVGDEQEAMDLSQDAFVKAYFALKSFREDSSLYTWLYKIVYNMALSALRRRRIVPFYSLDDREDFAEIPSDEHNPMTDCESTDIREAVDEALKKLPPRQRTVFTMRQFDGLKHEEIASIMGITEGAVKASYFHAVQKLRALLARYGEAYGLS